MLSCTVRACNADEPVPKRRFRRPGEEARLVVILHETEYVAWLEAPVEHWVAVAVAGTLAVFERGEQAQCVGAKRLVGAGMRQRQALEGIDAVVTHARQLHTMAAHRHAARKTAHQQRVDMAAQRQGHQGTVSGQTKEFGWSAEVIDAAGLTEHGAVIPPGAAPCSAEMHGTSAPDRRFRSWAG